MLKLVYYLKYVSYKIFMRFSVTDSKLMISSLQNRTEYLQYHSKGLEKQQVLFQWRINILRHTLQFVRLILHFEKYKYIRITFPPTKYFIEAFDGPDTLSPMLPSTYLNAKLHEMVTSSFQCILNVCMGCTNSFSYQYELHINSFVVTPVKSIILNYQNVSNFVYQYNTQQTNRNVDIISVLVPHNLKINITIQNLSHDYNQNFLCTYGGFVIHESMEAKENSQISAKCTPHRDIFRFQNIYSNGSVILLVVYSYREYGSMNLSVVFSTTKCSIVRVNCDPWNATQSLDLCTVFQFTNYLKYYEPWTDYGSIICYPYRNEQHVQKHNDSFVSGNLVHETFTKGYLKGNVYFS